MPRFSAAPRPTLLAAISALLLTTGLASAQAPQRFSEHFDGLSLTSVDPLDSSRWDVYVHSRALQHWLVLDPMLAAHGLDGAPPPANHLIDAYEDTVYTAREHVMTAINAEAYGVIYLTPNALADMSQGECVLRFDVSTLRTSRRDWIDLWLTPWDDHMIFPLEATLPDGQGNPRRGLQLRMETWSTVYQGQPVDWSHFRAFRYDNYAETALPHNVMGYEAFITPSPMMRQTIEVRVSRTHLRIGMPAFNLWWVDTAIADLGFDRAVIQFGHHSYNPTKDMVPAPIAHDTTLAGTANPSPNTWHWDAFEIEPVTRFDIIEADRRYIVGSAPQTITFDRPAPEGAFLRFAALGDPDVSFDGGPFIPATRQDGSRQVAGQHDESFFSSFWMPIPAGTQTLDVQLTATGIWAFHMHETMAKEFTIWSLAVGGEGCPGSAGLTPRAQPGLPQLGNAGFGIQLDNALANATAYLAISSREVETSLCGLAVDLLPDALIGLQALTTDGTGQAFFPTPVPAEPALLGLALYAQCAVLDPQGSFLAAGTPLALTPLRRLIIQ